MLFKENYKAVADFINNIGGDISVIPCERWEDHSLRPSIEDLLGAGALISLLKGTLSPESQIAKNVFQSNENNLRGFYL